MSPMVDCIEQFELVEGFNPSRLQGVRLFKSERHIPRTPLLYDPCICIVAQGKKIGYLGDRVFEYDANNYLVVSVTIPFECETIASPQRPLLGITIDVDLPQLRDLISRMKRRPRIGPPKGDAMPRGIGPAPMSDDITDATIRLLNALRSETESRILGPGLIREILFRVLCGPQSPVLYSSALHNGNFSQVARALTLMQHDYAQKLDVERLASEAHMSASAFHRAFKAVTSDSPMQYLKKVRLSKARDFMLQDQMKAYMAADKVGYESPSQFSREFKRYFGKSPADLIRDLRAA